MSTIAQVFEFSKQTTTLNTILWSGLVAGLLDSTAGVVVYYIF